MVDSQTLQKIVVLGTGGTIAGQSALQSDNIGYVAAQVGVEALMADIPGLAAHVAAYALVFEQVAQVDSKDMDEGVWGRLARRAAEALARSDVQGVVITHGTDTIEETAFFLQSVLRANKPVVLTCAMRPASALSPDGPQNLLDALSVVMDARAAGVAVVCAGVVHAAAHVQKIHTYRLDPFSSGEAGPWGWVEEGRVRWSGSGTRAPGPGPLWDVTALPDSGAWPQVELVMNHAGATGAVVNALVQSGVRGLVAVGTGNGTLSQPLTAALQHAMASGVRVLRSTRCPLGQVIAPPQATDHAPAGDAIPVALGLSPVKARIALQLALLDLPPAP